MKYTNETRKLSFDIEYEDKKILINGEKFWFDAENQIDNDYSIEDFIYDNIDEIENFIEKQEMQKMNTQEKDYETLRFFLDVENDHIDIFNYDVDTFSEQEKENTDVIIEINYIKQTINYVIIARDQSLQEVSYEGKDWNQEFSYGKNSIYETFDEAVNFLKSLYLERTSKIIETKIDNVQVSINLPAIAQSIDFNNFYRTTLVAEAKMYLIEEHKEYYDERQGWEVTDRQAYKNGYILKVRREVDYDFLILENLQTNDMLEVILEEMKLFAENYVICSLQPTCEKITCINLY